MGDVMVGMTISLDGFVEDAAGSVGRLYADLAGLRETDSLQETIRATGAVVMGRRAYDMAQGDLTGYEFQMPIFVATHHPPATPPKGQNDRLTVIFVTSGVLEALDRAQAAAGDKSVTVIGGASTLQQILKAGRADWLHVDVMPVLLGRGLRLFEHLEDLDLTLERVQVTALPAGRTQMRFRIVK